VGTQLNGKYAIKILGAQIDYGTPGDPTPAPIAGIGVFHADGACDITGGELIYNDNGTFTGPGTDPAPLAGITAFTGSLTANIVPASSGYYFNSNNQGILTLADSASGNTFQFGIQIGTGNAEFRGSRVNGPATVDAIPPRTRVNNDALPSIIPLPIIADSSPGDPVTIVGEKQAAVVTTAQFANPVALNFDGISTGGALGLGYVPISGQVQVNAGFADGGGNLFYNGAGTFGGSLSSIPDSVCDFTETFPSTPSTVDGTENTEAVFNGDFGCPLSGMDNETSSVLWGSTNQYAFVLTTGAIGAPFTGVSVGQADQTTISGLDHLIPPVAAIVIAKTSSVPVTKTLVLSNDTGEPLTISSIGLSGTLPDVSLTGSTCVVGDVPADNILIGSTFLVGTNTCTVVLTCNKSAAGTETGTLNITSDHPLAPAEYPATAPAGTFAVSCEKV